MDETKPQPQFVLLRWPAWWAAEPERTQRTTYYVGLRENDGSVTILLHVDGRDPAKAVELMRDPQRLRSLLKAEREDELWRQRAQREVERIEVQRLRSQVNVATYRKSLPDLFGGKTKPMTQSDAGSLDEDE